MTEALAAPLSAEDMVVQTMPEASPSKWHLAHTTWFFETFVLAAAENGYRPFHERFGFLFNSYYEGAGERHCRPRRGILSRPSIEEIRAYRAAVDERMLDRIARGLPERLESVVDLGLQHEQQHQELFLTDIKHVLGVNPLRPAYRERPAPDAAPAAPPLVWHGHAGGIRQIGYDGNGFAFDNERPRHRVFVEPFSLASRPVTCGEFLAFIEDGGYRRPELWLSEGWAAVQARGWDAPLYWEARDGARQIFTLEGMRALDPHEPACHLSLYEADAYARWAGARLPTEAEWETAAESAPVEGNFLDADRLHPVGGFEASAARPQRLFGDVWEWTASAYAPYPGFRPLPGTLGEYNGKFMVNQAVLRGGSCVSPASHLRPTYRNFFHPDARWQFSGIRLAMDGDASVSKPA